MLYAIIAIVVIVVAVVAGVLLLTGGGGGSINPNSISSAQSLKFTASLTGTSTSSDFSYTFYAKNIGTDNLMIRVEGTFSGYNAIYIVNGAQHKVWASTMGEWQDLSSDWESNWETWSGSLNDYRTNLGSWSGSGEYTYNYQGGTIRIYDIQINPTLSDSLFTH